MRRLWYRPRPPLLPNRTLLYVPLFFVLAIGWAIHSGGAYAQSEAEHRGPMMTMVPSRIHLPGLAPFHERLDEKLQKAYQAKGPDYRPRTHHLHLRGAPRFINRLIF